MGIKVYLGSPSAKIVAWIRAHQQPQPPAPHPETIFRMADNSISSFDWEGELDKYTVCNNTGLYDDDAGEWADIQSIEVGTKITSLRSTFSNCPASSIFINEPLSSIDQATFSNCSNLASISLPASIVSLGDGSFSGSGIRNITIPSNVSSIGNAAFNGCSNLTSIEIDEGVNGFGAGVFSNCTSLSSITFPSSATGTWYSMFSGCTSLVDITMVGKTIQQVTSMNYNVWGLQPGATIHCTDGDIVKS